MAPEKPDVFERKEKSPERDARHREFEEAKEDLQRRARESDQPKHPEERTSAEYEGQEPSD